VQADQPDSTKYLPFMPAAKWQSVLRANFKNMGDVFKNIYARVDLTYTFRQLEIYSAFGTETPTSDYALLNAGIGSDIINRKGNTLFSVSLTVSNILDKAYQSHLSRLKYAPENIATGRTGVYNMGRNFNVRLIVPITIK
jgi:iron complex outermembrane receptor protein